jgi:hypothetical protein
VCPQCEILLIRVGGYASGTTGEYFSTFTIAQGIIDAANYPGLQVINLSLGGGSDPADNQLTCPGAATLGAMQCAIDYAMSKNITVVAAAGNYNSDSPLYPAYISGVVSHPGAPSVFFGVRVPGSVGHTPSDAGRPGLIAGPARASGRL